MFAFSLSAKVGLAIPFQGGFIVKQAFLTVAAFGSIGVLFSQAGPFERIKERRAAKCAGCATTTEVVKETRQPAEIVTKEKFKVTTKPAGKTVEVVPLPAKAKN
ncbi:hypothetical protein EBT31_10120 [bacterium]|jgi:hypothetical protein|nr:hypothetical protein [bacterium]